MTLEGAVFNIVIINIAANYFLCKYKVASRVPEQRMKSLCLFLCCYRASPLFVDVLCLFLM